MRAVIYARISRDPEEQRLGVDRQERRGREVAEANGWRITDILIDNDKTGGNGDRPAFIELQARIVAGDVDVVIIQDQDRIARNLRVLLPFADLCADFDVRIESWSGPLDLVSADGELVASVKGATDAHYIRKLSEKSKAAHRDLARAGRPNGGIRPFGFDENRVDHDPTEAALIRQAARRILDGDSLRSIASEWQQAGITTPTGKPFVPVVIRRVLLNPRIAGRREIGHWKKDRETGKKHRVIDDVVDAVWEPIIALDTFRLVGEVLSAPGRVMPTGHRTLRYWLRGVATCGKCGRTLTTAQEGGTARRVYRCDPSPVGCGGIKASAAGAETVVEAALLAYLSDDRDRLTVSTKDLSDDTLRDRLDELTDRERDLGQAIARGTVTVAVAEEASAEIAELRSDLEARIVENTTTVERLTALEGLPHDLETLWPEMTAREKNRVLRLVVADIEIKPAAKLGPRFDQDRVAIEWASA